MCAFFPFFFHSLWKTQGKCVILFRLNIIRFHPSEIIHKSALVQLSELMKFRQASKPIASGGYVTARGMYECDWDRNDDDCVCAWITYASGAGGMAEGVGGGGEGTGFTYTSNDWEFTRIRPSVPLIHEVCYYIYPVGMFTNECNQRRDFFPMPWVHKLNGFLNYTTVGVNIAMVIFRILWQCKRYYCPNTLTKGLL